MKNIGRMTTQYRSGGWYREQDNRKRKGEEKDSALNTESVF